MFRTTLLSPSTARLALLLPWALLATACSGSDDTALPEANDTTANGTAGDNDDSNVNASGGSSNAAAAGGSYAGNASSNGGSESDDTGSGNGGSAGVAGPPDSDEPLGPEQVVLGSASNYAVLAQAAISNVPTSVITGDLGLSPAAASYVTGFPLTRAGTMWTTPEVIGGVFAADSDPTTPADLTTAVADMQTAYDDAAGRGSPDFANLGDGAIGGLTLAPGLYKWTSSVTIPSNVTLAGASDDVWIFQVTGDLLLSAAQRMTLSGGAQAKNIVWQVAGFVDLGAESHAEGILLSKTAINMAAGASINGRLFAQTAVTIASSTVTAPP